MAMTEEQNQIPDAFWGLFQSVNRELYIEALLELNREYEYSNFFLTKETCIQTLQDYLEQRRYSLLEEGEESPFDRQEPQAARVLNRLLAFGWLKRQEDLAEMVTHITIPDYAAIFIEAFTRLKDSGQDEAGLYIQNIYANLYSFLHDERTGIDLLRTAAVNTARLNKALQDMLHNMDSFFDRLIRQQSYSRLLKEHLDVYVEQIVMGKYHLLKTNDNFYRYKNDIKELLYNIRNDEGRIAGLQERMTAEGQAPSAREAQERLAQLLDRIERGIRSIEARIFFIDKEHQKYVRATLSRLNYLLSSDRDMHGMVARLLNRMAGSDRKEEMLRQVESRLALESWMLLSEESLYRPRGKYRVFEDTLEAETLQEPELSREKIMLFNKTGSKYSREQIEQFVLSRMEDGVYRLSDSPVTSVEEFELLILAYDYSLRKSSPFRAESLEGEMVEQNGYRYPNLIFTKKT